MRRLVRVAARVMLSAATAGLGVVIAGAVAAGPGSGPAGATTLLAGTALVANWGSNSVTPINTETDAAGSPIGVGTEPDAIAITPNGATAYVANWGSNSVTPIDLSTGKTEKAISVGRHPDAIAIAPDGVSAYVANFGSSSVTPINVEKNTAGTAISVGPHPDAVAISPSNELAWVTSQSGGYATEISVLENKFYATAFTNSDPTDVAFSPDGSTAYFTNLSSDEVTPFDTSTGKSETAIGVGTFPRDIALSPDGSTAYVSDFGSDQIQAIGTAEGRAGAPVTVGGSPMGLAVTPDGSTLYVADSGSNEVTPITTSDLTAGTPIAVGHAPDAIAITPGWTDQAFVTSASTADSVAFAYFEGSLYAAWTDAVSGDEVLYSSFDGTTWSTPEQIAWSGGSALSNAGPSLVPDGGDLYAAWKGKNSGAQGVYISYFNGKAWSKQDELSWGKGDYAKTADAPVISVDIGDPVVAWTTTSDNVDVSYASGIDIWTKPVELTGSKGVVTTTYSPALTWSPVLDTMVAAWTTSTGTIGYLPFDTGEEGTVPSALTISAPALCSTGEGDYVAWEGKTGNKIWYSATWPDYTGWSTWAEQTTEPQALTSLKPAFATNGYTVTVGWKGLSSEIIGFASAVTPY